jgi:hypothetical protein
MTDADDRLRALFASDAPAVRDTAFSAEVMAALARRRFTEDMLSLAGLAALGGVLLWAFWPLIGPALAVAGLALAPLAGALTLAAVAVMLLGRPVAAMLGLES